MAWIGALIGAVGGLLANSGGGDSTTTTNNVPPELAPLAGGVAQRGTEIGNMPFNPYPYNTTAGFNPYQFAGFDQIAGQAMGDQNLLGAAANNLTGTLNGDYLNGNPYLDQMVNQTAGDVQGRLNAQAFNSGSFGIAGVAQAGAQGLANAENQLRYGAYNDERQRQMQGLGMAPGIAAAQYMPGQQLLGIGGTMQQQGQNELNQWQSQFQDAQNWPFRTYDAMLAPFGRNLGGSSTQTGPGSNPVAGLLGGAMLGNRMQGGQNWGGMFSGGGSSWQPQQGGNSNWAGDYTGGVDYGAYY